MLRVLHTSLAANNKVKINGVVELENSAMILITKNNFAIARTPKRPEHDPGFYMLDDPDSDHSHALSRQAKR